MNKFYGTFTDPIIKKNGQLFVHSIIKNVVKMVVAAYIH